jgi:hypothetical protein
MTNCGRVGWVSDRRGYRYLTPESGPNPATERCCTELILTYGAMMPTTDVTCPVCGTAWNKSTEPGWVPPREVFTNRSTGDRYTIENEIGRGGMATVYRARDPRHDRSVAVKVLNADVAAALGTERFLQEIKTVASLTHPHIVPVHDSGETGGVLFYVMPHIEGETLRDKINREKQLSPSETVRLTRTLASAEPPGPLAVTLPLMPEPAAPAFSVRLSSVTPLKKRFRRPLTITFSV